MPAVLPLKEMSIEEKIQAMEALWDDLCKNAGSLTSPSWHRDILKERERMIDSGEDEFMDWDRAKQNIRDNAS